VPKGLKRSAAVMVNNSGVIKEESDFYPFGRERIIVDQLANNHKFTGYERGSEHNKDYAVYRFFNPSWGRFLSPDPLAGDIGNPQSLTAMRMS
jgi:RHS repeat-associated protein